MFKYKIEEGAVVECAGKQYAVVRVLNFEEVLAKAIDDGRIITLKISNIKPPAPAKEEKKTPDMLTVNATQWKKATAKFESIKEYTYKSASLAKMQEVAEKMGVHISTAYRWRNKFESTGRIISLLDEPRGGKGKTRLTPEQEKIIQDAIVAKLMNNQKNKPSKVVKEVEYQCRRAKLPIPHENTIRNRIKLVSGRLKLIKQGEVKLAKELFDPKTGEMPDANWPLQVVMIDHTKMDIEVVDDIQRKAIGRPWLTVAIDVFSRMILGIYLTFDHPCAASVGMCIASAVLKKDDLLAKHGINLKWPAYGVMAMVQSDNGKEFRGGLLKEICKDYTIILEWRPAKQSRYGSYIESLCGTLNSEIHTLPGTTFSNVTEKGEYDSEKNAVMTRSALEKWLIKHIVGDYHQREHSGLGKGISPMMKYEEGIFGNETTPGTGLPEIVEDEVKFEIDMMPFTWRTVQDYGIVFDHIRYYADVLSPWINTKDPDDPNKARTFIVRRDPRDISVIYFYDPELETYFEIPYRNTSFPRMTMADLVTVTKKLKANGHTQIDEDIIFATYEENQALVDDETKLTKAARRKKQKNNDNMDRVDALRKKMPVSPTDDNDSEYTSQDDEILPYDDVDEMG